MTRSGASSAVASTEKRPGPSWVWSRVRVGAFKTVSTESSSEARTFSASASRESTATVPPARAEAQLLGSRRQLVGHGRAALELAVRHPQADAAGRGLGSVSASSVASPDGPEAAPCVAANATARGFFD